MSARKRNMINYYEKILDTNKNMTSSHRIYIERELNSWIEFGGPSNKLKKSKAVKETIRRSNNPILCDLNSEEYSSMMEFKSKNNIKESNVNLYMMLNGKANNIYGLRRKFDKYYLLNEVKKHYQDIKYGMVSITELSEKYGCDWETIQRRIKTIEEDEEYKL